MVVSSVTPLMPAAIVGPALRVLGSERRSSVEDDPALLGLGRRPGRARRRPARTRGPCGRAGWRRRRRRGSCWGRRRRASAAPARCTTSTPRGSRPSRRRPARPAGSSGVPFGPTAMAAAAWSWVEKMLQEAQRTSAPSAASVSMSTAVWMVMCSEPVMRAPLSGWASAYSARMAIRPGISCSASWISLRPKSASERSATLKSGVGGRGGRGHAVSVGVVGVGAAAGQEAHVLLLLEATASRPRATSGGRRGSAVEPAVHRADQVRLRAQALGERDVGQAELVLGRAARAAYAGAAVPRRRRGGSRAGERGGAISPTRSM